MKTNLKSLQILFTLVFIMVNCYSETDAVKQYRATLHSNTENDSLKARIVKLEKLTVESEYTRIPNKDFENILDNKIQKSMREIVNWWLIIIGALITVLGFLATKYANTFLQNIAEGKVNQLKKENEEKIKSISNHYFSTVIDSLLDFKIEIIMKQNNRVEELVVDDLKGYLTDESITISESKKVIIIDTIMRCYYYSNFPDRIKKMIDLIREYEEQFTLYSSTYINAALAFSEYYENYGTKDYLNSAIENCNKSIKILPDYGLAFAQKLELYTMAISKAFDDTEKMQYETELFRVFKDIENNQSTYLCTELIKRIEIDKDSIMDPYIKNLYSNYNAEMAKIEARATSSTNANPTVNPVVS
jgi:hypothetical protein